MSVIVRDDGFHSEDWNGEFTPFADLPPGDGLALTVPPDTDPEALRARLADFAFVRVEFPAFNDGRGFTIGRELRRMGFTGRLRAAGKVIADQYTMTRRVGFDEVEIPDDLAARQPEEQWKFRADWRSHDYLSRLRG